MDTQAMLSAIESYVLSERERRGVVNVNISIKAEPSGEGFDEFVVLLERQLMTTEFGHGGWKELSDEGILAGVYQLVEQRIKWETRPTLPRDET